MFSVGEGHRSAGLDLRLKQGNDAAVGTQHVAEPHRHALHVRAAGRSCWMSISVTRLVAPMTLVGLTALSVESCTSRFTPCSEAEAGADSERAKDVVFHRLRRAAFLHQRHVLVSRRVEHDFRPVLGEYLVQTALVPNGADEHLHGTILTVSVLQFPLQFVGAVFINVENNQLFRRKAHHLTADFRCRWSRRRR